MAQTVIQENGVLKNGSSGSCFGSLYLGSGYSTTLLKTQCLLLDRTYTASGLGSSSSGELYTADVVGTSEAGRTVIVNIPSATASGLSNHFKSAVVGLATTAALSAFPVVYQATGVVGQASTTGAVAQGTIAGVQGQVTVAASTDATASAVQASIINTGLSAVSTVGTALSKYVLDMSSSGTSKNTAFMYARKQASGAIAAANCAHGLLVDGDSVDANAFAVVTGTTPTVVWGVSPAGKTLTSVTAPASGGGPFAAGAGTNITIALTGLTTAPDTASASIVVNTTAVTASSRIRHSVIAYAGTYVTNGIPIVVLGPIVAATSFAFQIINIDATQALSGQITIAFWIEN